MVKGRVPRRKKRRRSEFGAVPERHAELAKEWADLAAQKLKLLAEKTPSCVLRLMRLRDLSALIARAGENAFHSHGDIRSAVNRRLDAIERAGARAEELFTRECFKNDNNGLAGNGCSEGVERAVHLALRRASDLDEHDTHFRRAHRFAWDAVKSMNDGDCESAGDLAKAAIKLAAK